MWSTVYFKFATDVASEGILKVGSDLMKLWMYESYGRSRSCSASDSAYSYTFLRSVVFCLSVVCLSHSCPLLKPFDGFRCHLYRYTRGVQWHIVLDGGPWPHGESKDSGLNPNKIAKLSVICCNLVNTNEEFGGLATAIPPFAKLLWSLFCKTVNELLWCKALELASLATQAVQYKDWWWKLQLGKCYYRSV